MTTLTTSDPAGAARTVLARYEEWQRENTSIARMDPLTPHRFVVPADLGTAALGPLLAHVAALEARLAALET